MLQGVPHGLNQQPMAAAPHGLASAGGRETAEKQVVGRWTRQMIACHSTSTSTSTSEAAAEAETEAETKAAVAEEGAEAAPASSPSVGPISFVVFCSRLG